MCNGAGYLEEIKARKILNVKKQLMCRNRKIE